MYSMDWESFAADAPEMAEFGRLQFAQSGVAVIGTIRRDGSPRISHGQPTILDGSPYLGMMWQSRKARDLLRDPRIVICNAVCTNTGEERELCLRGRVVAVLDPAVRRSIATAVADRTERREPWHLFRIEIATAALVAYGGGEQSVSLWPQGASFSRPYG
jgi:hypothetical protein